MWKYDQSAGALSRDGKPVSAGYSGKGRGKNNPSLQGVQGIGPIPAGKWRMVRCYNSANVGPVCIEIHAIDATPGDDWHDVTGRGHFRVHGDSIKAPGTASKGCIILPRPVRLSMWAAAQKGDDVIEVVA
jgi:hypothetical protein